MFIFILALLFGCQQNKEQEALPLDRNNNRIIQVNDPNQEEERRYSNKEIASHLANVAGHVPNVNDAVAIVAGPYVVVGIDVNKDLDRSRVGTIKYTVSEALQHDPYGKTAVVVADGDIMERLRSMGEEIQNGQPIRGIVDELSAIVGRYMPDFPINEDYQQEPDQNKELMDDEENQELDDIEEEQSEE